MAKKVDNVSVGVDIDGDGKPDFAFDIKTIGGILVSVSYTHLTLPTNREV